MADFDAMFAQQGECCAICKTTEPGHHGWAIDHCHTTGKVRGILCQKCNPMLGYARDQIAILEAAIDYLMRALHSGKL
jgi:Recombination endonuclease VII